MENNHKKGVRLASLSILITVVTWLILKKVGFVGSVAALIGVVSAYHLYRIGSKSSSLGKGYKVVVLFPILGVFLAIMISILIDAHVGFVDGAGQKGTILSAGFWTHFWQTYTFKFIWANYVKDLWSSIAMLALGYGSIFLDYLMVKQADQN